MEKKDLFQEVQELIKLQDSRFDRERVVSRLIEAKLDDEVAQRQFNRWSTLGFKILKGIFIFLLISELYSMAWKTIKYMQLKSLVKTAIPEVKELLIDVMKQYKK